MTYPDDRQAGEIIQTEVEALLVVALKEWFLGRGERLHHLVAIPLARELVASLHEGGFELSRRA